MFVCVSTQCCVHSQDSPLITCHGSTFCQHSKHRDNHCKPFCVLFSCLSTCSHALVLFGGVQGLEYSLECDESLKTDNVSDLCDLYLNLCPGQGSRTIRTEVSKLNLSCECPLLCFLISHTQEAILIGLSSLRPLLRQAADHTSST